MSPSPELAGTQDQIDSTQAGLDTSFDLAEKKEKTQKKLDSVTQTIKDIDDKTKTANETRETTELTLKDTLTKRTETQTTIKTTTEQKNTLSDSVSKRTKTIESKKKELDTFESYEPDSPETINRRAEIAKLEQENSAEKLKIKALEVQIAELVAKERELEKQITQLSQELERIRAEIAGLVADREQSTLEQSSISGRIVEIDVQIEDENKRIHAIEEGIARSQQMYADNSAKEQKPGPDFFNIGGVWA